MGQSANKSLFSGLWERRLPQFFATYIGVCWGILQFLNFATNRYGLEDSYIDKFLIFVTVLIPAVLIYIYNHGKPGKDSWTKLEKFFIPDNFIVAAALAFVISGPQAASAAPTAVEITTDDGNQITRMVPAQSQIRQLVVFPFKISEGGEDWVRFGLPHLMKKDLEQDMRISVRDAGTLEYYYNSHEYEIDDDLPFSIKLKIAQKTMLDYFVTGNVQQADGQWQVDINVNETSSGDTFFKQTFSSPDLYELTDNITTALSKQLFLKDSDSEFSNFTDLPASDLITTNQEALKTYIKANHLFYFEEEYAKAAELFQSAISLDDKSAELKAMASACLKSLGDIESAKKLISESLKQSKTLPERQQFDIKKTYWVYDNKLDNALALMKNWIKLYPSDFDPHQQLFRIYKMTYQLRKAKDIGLTAIKNGHKNRILKSMVDLCIQNEEFDEAESYLMEYHLAYPELVKEDTRMADIYIKKGNYDKAIELYNQHLIDDPENGDLQAELAKAYFISGEFEKSELTFERALEYSVQAPDSAAIYKSQLELFSTLGQKYKVIELSDKWLDCLRSFLPETSVATQTMGGLGYYGIVGAGDYIRSYYGTLVQQMPQMAPVLDCVSNFIIYLFGNNAVEFRKIYKGECNPMVLQGTPNLENMASGFLNSMEGNHQAAIKDIETYIENSGAGGNELGYLLAKEYRLLGKADKGIWICKDYLETSPNNTSHLFELAMSQTASMDLEGAKETYKKLQKLWNKAEPGFIYYDDYIALGKQLGIE